MKSYSRRANSHLYGFGQTQGYFHHRNDMPQADTLSDQNGQRFVVLYHYFPDNESKNHYDLMLEERSGLATWSFDKFPSTGQTISARRLTDHRKRYLDYEGSISGGRGSVRQEMTGQWLAIQSSDSDRTILLKSNDQEIRLQISGSPTTSNSITRMDQPSQ